ncbi:cell growth regulator with RING finger domain protein 1 [Brienomyrus brachyistius]|uniref:cell growth regulator with RING finger domain protein 1 n=1 Tax=Brienomyrus brachyistius TaxID=42636 RepID=UPI0020B29ED6|nr:cell growth regulator with RING finger domain protein 1 [Brienomyrus brachyistius]
MAAEFLVMLYEYCPPFYISIVSLCFIITVAMVLGWFGFDVPIILRSSDDADSVANIPEKRMVQVTNPFALELGSAPASVTGGVVLRPRCLEECRLSCYWGCGVQGLQAALHAHRCGPPISTPQRFQEALHFQYQHVQTFHIDKEDPVEHLTQMPASLRISHFGVLPRACYPLVVLLTLAEPDIRDIYNIVASVTVVHVPDEKYQLSERILFQYLLTVQGNMYELKPLFMSTGDGSQAESTDLTSDTEQERPNQAGGPLTGTIQEDEDEGAAPGAGRDCVVCQNAPVNRVLLPCRHTCLCDGCVSRVRHCPMCRAFVLEAFALCQRPLEVEQEGHHGGE